MKSIKIFYYLAATLFVIPCFNTYAQDSKIVVSNSQIIKNPAWDVIIENVVSNPYNEKGYLEGKDFIKFEGYSLAETLMRLSKHAGGYVEIDNLPENPPIALTLRFENSTLNSVWTEAIEKITSHYKATLTKITKKVSFKLLTVVDNDKFSKNKSKNNKPGVLNSTTVKDNKAILKNYNLKNLAQWLSDNYTYSVKSNSSNTALIDFTFPTNSWSVTENTLLNKYGISVTDLTEEREVFVVSY